MSEASGAVQKLPAAYTDLDAAKVSPAGKYVAFNASKDSDAEENVYVMASDGSGQTVVSPSATYQEPIEWTPDGKYIIYGQFAGTVSLWAAPVANGKVQGPAFNTHAEVINGVQILAGATRAGAAYYRSLSRTADIYTATMDPSSGKVTSLPIPVPTEHTGDNVVPRWAPDSRRLAHVWAQPGPTLGSIGSRQLMVYSFDTGKETRVGSQATFNPNAYCWNRDGASILLNSAGNPRQTEAARVSLVSDQVVPLFPGAPPFSLRTCAGDIAVGVRASAIEARNLATGAEKEVYKDPPGTDSGLALVAQSHDGRSIAFITRRSNTSTIKVVSTDGGRCGTW